MDTTKTEANTTIDNTIETTTEIIIPIEIIETIITPDIMIIEIIGTITIPMIEEVVMIEERTTQNQIHEITLIHTIEHVLRNIDK